MSDVQSSDVQADSGWQGELVDAYCHAGEPKYGSVADAMRFFERLGIRRSVIVLGPGIPDMASLVQARRVLGDRVRVMGIPFGETEAQRLELGELQMRLGISGMRVTPDELESNLALIDRLGEAGKWLYAINPFGAPGEHMRTTRRLLAWLERHTTGRIASPHFLRSGAMEQWVEDTGLFKELLQHPRFHAIFSRQGGSRSAEPYPHPDLLPWVEQIAEHMTWKRIMWGSEFPITYQRSEQPEDTRDWLLSVGARASETERADFYANNARRLFFDADPPQGEDVDIPAWVDRQIDQAQTVYLFPSNMVYIGMHDHGALLSHYMEIAEAEPGLDYAQYISRLLSAQAAQLRDS